MNKLLENAIRVEYPKNKLELSTSALFLVRNYPFGAEYDSLVYDMKNYFSKRRIDNFKFDQTQPQVRNTSELRISMIGVSLKSVFILEIRA